MSEKNVIPELGTVLGEERKEEERRGEERRGLFSCVGDVRWQGFRCSVRPVSCTTSTWRISCVQHNIAGVRKQQCAHGLS